MFGWLARVSLSISNSGDIVTIAAPELGASDIVARLEPILLTEPKGQPQQWLAAKQGRANQEFLEALRNFMYWENYDVRVRMDGKIDRTVLQDIFEKRGVKREM